MNSKATPFVIGALVLALALAALVVTPVTGQEGPVSLSTLARQIRAGEIDVGEEYGMAEEQRFHVIHAEIIDMSCKQCHVKEAPYEVAVPLSDDANPVDRRVCLGCHLNGPAQPLYDPQE